MLLLSVVAAAMLFGSASRAEERSEDECFRLHPDITSPVEMVTCTSDLAGSERELASVFAVLQARTPAEYRDQLDKAQRSWTAYRNAQCLWEAGGNAGNTIHDSVVIACNADMNRARVKYLRNELESR